MGRLGASTRLTASPRTALRGRRLLAARAAWVAATVLIVGLSIAAVPGAFAGFQAVCEAAAGCRAYWRLEPEDVLALRGLGLTANFYAAYMLAAEIACMLGFWVVGAVIFWRRPDDWLAMFFSLMLVTFGASNMAAWLTDSHGALGLLGASVGFLGYASFYASFFVFPDGRMVPRWGLLPILIWTAHQASFSFLPEGSPLHPLARPALLNLALAAGLFGVMVFAQVHRYRKVSGPVERQQTKWVVFGLAAAVGLALAAAVPLALSPEGLRTGTGAVLYALTGQTVASLSLLLVPLSLGVAILRYRLWDIDVIINRALVYGALTASLVGVYALVVGGLGALLRAPGNLAVSLLAAGLVAVLFAPLRERLQRGANRLMYGERDEPYTVLSRLGRRLEAAIDPDAALQTIVETVAGALKLPYAAISVREGDDYRVVAHHGSPTGEGTSLPLAHGGETIGQLILAPRSPGEVFSPADRRLLEDLARNAEAAVHAVRLTADLQRSRERLVSAREEERRRLRRDLHDGLGPTLATLTLGLDVSMRLLKKDPEEAGGMLLSLKSQTQEAVGDIRRLVYGLRPPALDDLGLVAAVREQAAGNGRLAEDLPGGADRRIFGGVVFSVEAPEGDGLPPLPAAVEVACYRIAQEAITNVVRHARAGSCRVRLSIDGAGDELVLEVSDDGTGVREGNRAGVGMNSMRERAKELGGTLSVGPAPGGGTRVLARLPLFAEEQG